MIRDIGQRGHEKRRKSGIVRGRGKAGGGGGVAKKRKKQNNNLYCFSFFSSPPPPSGPGPSRPLKGPLYSSETLKASLPLPLQDLKA